MIRLSGVELPLLDGGERVGVEVEGDAEGGVDDRAEVEATVLDGEGGEVAGLVGAEEVGVGREHLLLDGGGVHRESLEVMVAVALDACDAQGGADGEVLLEA